MIHVRWITGTEERSDSLIGCEQTARLPNPPSLPRMSPDVSRHLTESHVTLLSLTALCPSFFPSFFFSSYVFDSATIGILSAIWNSCSRTLSRITAILLVFPLPIFLFSRFMLLRISRDPAIFVFVIELDVRLFSVFFFFIFRFFLIFLRPFFSFAHFRLWFCNFLSLVSVLFNPLSFLSIPRRPQSHLSIRHESTLLSRSLFLLFFSLICLFRIFRIRFSARAFYVSRSFSRIIPVFLKPLPLLRFILLFLSVTFFNSSLSLFLTASPSSIYFDRS